MIGYELKVPQVFKILTLLRSHHYYHFSKSIASVTTHNNSPLFDNMMVKYY